jgi:hypothetical protein
MATVVITTEGGGRSEVLDTSGNNKDRNMQEMLDRQDKIIALLQQLVNALTPKLPKT